MDVEVTQVGPGVYHARARHVSWTLVTEGVAVTLVDTGYPRDRDRLLRSLELVGRRASDVDAVVLTHGHPDHLGSAEHLRSVHGVPVLAHQAEVPNASGARVEQVSQRTSARRHSTSQASRSRSTPRATPPGTAPCTCPSAGSCWPAMP